ncbi:kinesin, partial [Helicosporidium sp. ATCC 50920]
MVNTTMSPNSMNYEGDTGSVKANVVVAVRFRPLSNRERDRGDVEVWECQGNEVGILDDAAGMQVKFAYDYVFDGSTSNSDVYRAVASPIVSGAMEGLSGTVFAYGVTSSGKTHTMMGDETVPGVVPHAMAEVFAAVARHAGEKEYSLKVSMMEIYNEVLNDLLDPSRSNLKLREDPKRGGVLAEGILEEPLTNVHQALAVIARGNENRKTSATAFNEGSSRSHTIIRLQIEARQAPGAAGGAGSRVVSCLNLIDLAGSESAKAERTASHRMEGSFINKSLLTLGTVIHKLAESRAAHIPFRDSKLTRLLSGSLSGTGARVAVVCTITPASTQAEETHNTLKFASRAKRISITVHKNEIVDQSSLISRYQQEIAVLRSQLEHARGPGGGGGGALLAGPRDPLDP